MIGGVAGKANNPEIVEKENAAAMGFACICCGKPGVFRIQLALDTDEEGPRYYLPNQHARTAPHWCYNVMEAPFCKDCMRYIEDALRDAIARRQEISSLNEVVAPL